ncbi:MAG TPA: NADH-quinone oxidoreductase subunit M [Terriglobales bacterium]|nr:NADH-quinone oxidoreductase subunit M [Terriglobales bacterium]
MNDLVKFGDKIVLTAVIALPALGAFILMFFPRGSQHTDAHGHKGYSSDSALKWAALGLSLLTFVLSLHLPCNFDYKQAGFQPQFDVDIPWIASPNIHFRLGVDGLSMWLVVLTTFLVPLSIISSWKSIHGRVKEFLVLMLFQEAAMIGVFLSLDTFLFYVFWEATLIPMALLIGVYGHERRVYAAVKFFLYTMVASVFMLAAIIWLYIKTGSFDYLVIQAALLNSADPAFTSALSVAAPWLFLAFFVAFAVKVPLFPFHTWLPDAHVEAPTAGSILLAGVLLKMGTYGLMRFNVALFPEQARVHAPWIIALALIGIIYGALVALVQPNLKKLIAYSSVSHLGFVVLGIFSFTTAGADGAIYQMLNHGVSTGALFMLAGMLYDRRHTYEIKQFGGLATPMPMYAMIFLLITLSSIGLPLMNGFVGEFLILTGAFQAKGIYGMLATTGVIWSAGYMLWLYQRTFFGTIKLEVNRSLPDVDFRERLAVFPLVALALIMGLASPYWMKAIDPAARAINEAHTSVIKKAFVGQQRMNEKNTGASDR